MKHVLLVVMFHMKQGAGSAVLYEAGRSRSCWWCFTGASVGFDHAKHPVCRDYIWVASMTINRDKTAATMGSQAHTYPVAQCPPWSHALNQSCACSFLFPPLPPMVPCSKPKPCLQLLATRIRIPQPMRHRVDLRLEPCFVHMEAGHARKLCFRRIKLRLQPCHIRLV